MKAVCSDSPSKPLCRDTSEAPPQTDETCCDRKNLTHLHHVSLVQESSRGSAGRARRAAPSPKRLKARTTEKIAAPGHIAIQGASSRKFFAVLSMLPQPAAADQGRGRRGLPR